MKTIATVTIAAAGAIVAAGCPRPAQYGGPIPVDSTGVASRLERLCALRTGAANAAACAATETEQPAAP